MKITYKILALLISFIGIGQAFAAGKIQMNEYMVESDTPSISLYVRNKHLAGLKTKRTPCTYRCCRERCFQCCRVHLEEAQYSEDEFTRLVMGNNHYG